MAVLGLLVQQPDTLAGLGIRLESEHPGARWPSNIVHTSVKSLVKQGLVRPAQPGSEHPFALLEATPEGTSQFRQLLRESSAVLPAIRDALRSKLRYIADEVELQRVVRDIREQEELCIREAEAARSRYRTAQRLGRLDISHNSDWSTRVRCALMTDEVRVLLDQVRSLRRLREDLEDGEGDRDVDEAAGNG